MTIKLATLSRSVRAARAAPPRGGHRGVELDTLADPAIAECIRRGAAGWSLRSARDVTIVYPFVFRTPS